MKYFAVTFFLVSAISLWSQDTPSNQLLPKEAYAKFQGHVIDFAQAEQKIEGDLQLSIPDERLLLHLGKRGLPHLASLVYNGFLGSYASESAFSRPDRNLKTWSREESVVEDLLARAATMRLAANDYACFQILKTLAPTPEAIKFETQAKELLEKILAPREGSTGTDHQPTEAEFLQSLESIRALFDQLKDLPKLTEKQLADERTETAVLARREYGDDNGVALPQSAKKWVDRELKWHREWDHQGYLLAYSQLTGSNDYEQLKMVINLRGGIFEWSRSYIGSHFYPESYESKLPEAEFGHLEDFLTKLPPSDVAEKNNHFVVSFLQGGRWTTLTYNSLPAECPFQNLLTRMVRQSATERSIDAPPGNGFLKPDP